MQLRGLVKLDKISDFLKTVRLSVVMALLSLSFVLATALTFFGGYYLKPDATASSFKRGGGKSTAVSVRTEGLTGSHMDLIKKRNIFNSEGLLGDDEEVQVKEDLKPVLGKTIKSKLPLKLQGVIFGGAPEDGLAMLRNTRKQRISSYLAGDTVIKGVILKEIYEDRVILDNKGSREYVLLERKELQRSKRDRKKKPKSSGPRKIAPLAKGPAPDSFKEDGFERQGHSITITQTYKEALLGPQMSKVLQDAKAEPNMVAGELRGFRLTRIREDSIYQKVGFQSGDVVLEINGVPLTDAAGAIKLLQSLRQEKEVEVRVQRGSDLFNMDLTIQ